MSGLYGDFTAKSVRQGSVAITTSSWVPLVSLGSTPYSGRRHIRIQLKSNKGGSIALQYVSKNADGTFTTPTASSSVKLSTIIAGNTTYIEPIADTVNVYGKLVKKVGFTDNSIRAIITEYK